MEESFRVRVDKVFGALSAPSSWTLSDEEIESKEWNGDKETGSDSDDHLSPARKETGDEFRDIRSSVGLDCTLDFEEEEDEVDRVALGLEEEEDSCDRVYMIEMDPGYGIDVNAHIEDSFDQRSRDPRANHCAARIRLMEDAPSQPLKPILKPILKNRESHSLSAKRVRFHQHSLDRSLPSGGGGAEAVVKDDPTLPDYLRNPTSYTRYTLDDSSNDLDEASNRKACMDLFHLLNKKRDCDCDEAPQQPLTFTPRNKPSLVKEEGPSRTKFVLPSVAATDDEMETDNMGGDTVRTHNKPGRHYRMRTVLDSDT